MDSMRNDVADFSYETASCGPHDAARLPARVSVFSDNLRMRSQIVHDLEGAGFRSVEGGVIDDLLDGPIADGVQGGPPAG